MRSKADTKCFTFGTVCMGTIKVPARFIVKIEEQTFYDVIKVELIDGTILFIKSISDIEIKKKRKISWRHC